MYAEGSGVHYAAMGMKIDEVIFFEEETFKGLQKGRPMKFTLIWDYAKETRRLVAVIIPLGKSHGDAKEKVKIKPPLLEYEGGGSISGSPPSAKWGSLSLRRDRPADQKEASSLLRQLVEKLKVRLEGELMNAQKECPTCHKPIEPGKEAIWTADGSRKRKKPVCQSCHEESVRGIGRGSARVGKGTGPKQADPGRSDRTYGG